MVEVTHTPPGNLALPVKLLEELARDGEPLPQDFVGFLREEVERGNIEILSAYMGDSVVGVAALAFRPGISFGGHFASIEDLYVKPEARRHRVGTAILEAIEKLCASKDVSYVEVQAVDEDAVAFYSSLGYEPEHEVRVLSRSLPLRKAGD